MGCVGALMMLGMLLLWTLVIVGGILLVRLLWTGTNRGQASALATLQARFAHGEIDREEYEERRSVIQRRW